MARMNSNIGDFMSELDQLESHINELNHPKLLSWQADIVTRLIEVAHSKEPNLSSSSLLLTAHYLDHETMSRGYSLAARKISLETMRKFGLGEQHYEVLRRYDEVRMALEIYQALMAGLEALRLGVMLTCCSSLSTAARILSTQRVSSPDGLLPINMSRLKSSYSGLRFSSHATVDLSARVLPSFRRYFIVARMRRDVDMRSEWPEQRFEDR